MSRRFYLNKDPYGVDVEIFQKRSVTIKPGLTVLVGCNGIGKTTLLNTIENRLKKDKIPVFKFNNLSQGGSNSASVAFDNDDFGMMAAIWSSSEGEGIISNITYRVNPIKEFLQTGLLNDKASRFARIWNPLTEEEMKEIKDCPERWLLFDATDSGLSIDNVIDLKAFFKLILEDIKDKDIYIVIAANEYELASGENCFDVYNGKYLKFKSYEDYRNMILKSREEKNNRKILEHKDNENDD